MMIQDGLKAARFKANPFRIVPPTDIENVHWVGDRMVIDSLLEAARSPRADILGTSELVVLFGEYGSGKTNALKYLGKMMRAEDALVAYVPHPKVTDRPYWHDIVLSLFSNVFRKDNIAERLTKLRRFMLVEAQDRAKDELGEGAGNPDELAARSKVKLADVAQEIMSESPGFVLFAIDLAGPKKDRNWSYLSGKPTAQLGRDISSEYNLPADGLTTDYGATLLLSSLVRTLTSQTRFGVGTEVVCLLIDEVEDLNDLAPVARMSILQGLRDIVNACTEHLFIAVATTASDAAELWGTLDTPLMQRLSRAPEQFPTMDPSQAKAFMIELMGLYRDENYDGPPEWPFSEDGLDAFVQSCPPPLTPRKLLVSAGRLCFTTPHQLSKVVTGQPVDSADVAGFTSWGA